MFNFQVYVLKEIEEAISILSKLPGDKV